MARKSKWVKNQHIDGWVLKENIGRGGNGEVWKATKDEQTVALKILYNFNDKYRYERFKREIQSNEIAEDVSGILPIIEYSLPDKPTKENPLGLPCQFQCQ